MTFTFEELLQADVLEQAFLLRFEKYNQGDYKCFLNNRQASIDIDISDFYSKHWGVFDIHRNLLGYARTIESELNVPVKQGLLQVMEKFSLPKLKLPRFSFALINYQTPASKKVLTQFIDKNPVGKIIELSRFAIKEGCSIKISKFMVYAGLGINKKIGQKKIAILACNVSHERFWRLFGFQRIDQDSEYYVGGLHSINLFLKLNEVEKSLDEKLNDFGASYLRNNKIVLDLCEK